MPTGFLVDEKMISVRNKIRVRDPIRVFNLQQFGIMPEVFIRQMAPTFSLLEVDQYDVKRRQVEFLKNRYPVYRDELDYFLRLYYQDRAQLDDCYDFFEGLPPAERQAFDRIGLTGRRTRAIAKYRAVRDDRKDEWVIARRMAENYFQQAYAGDDRPTERTFREIPAFLDLNTNYRAFLSGTCELVRSVRPKVEVLRFAVHQMCVYADVLGEACNSPEGIHQDGADYIISALVVERAGIIGGESVVYGPDKKTEYLRRALQPGEGLFQADAGSPLWHTVTPIQEDSAIPPPYGNRSIFGLDFYIEE